MENKDSNKLSCTFCGKGQEEVRKLIAGPSVYICDECVDLCNYIIEEEVKAEKPKKKTRAKAKKDEIEAEPSAEEKQEDSVEEETETS